MGQRGLRFCVFVNMRCIWNQSEGGLTATPQFEDEDNRHSRVVLEKYTVHSGILSHGLISCPQARPIDLTTMSNSRSPQLADVVP